MAEIKKALSVNLNERLKERYDELPQANMLCRLFNLRCGEEDIITEDIMQDWLNGKTSPTTSQLKILQQWLGLNLD